MSVTEKPISAEARPRSPFCPLLGLAYSTSALVGFANDMIASMIRRGITREGPRPARWRAGRDRVAQVDIAGSLAELVGQAVETVLTALKKTEPELAPDICEHGIVVTGGKSLLLSIDRVQSKATGRPMTVAKNALRREPRDEGLSLLRRHDQRLDFGDRPDLVAAEAVCISETIAR